MKQRTEGMRIPIQVTETEGLSRFHEPVEIGLPLPIGEASPQAQWFVLDEKERVLPSQFKPLINYEDGSLRAMHGVFLADLKPGQSRSLTVMQGEYPVGKPILNQADGLFRMRTGKMEAGFNKMGELTTWCLNGTELLAREGGPSLKPEVVLGPGWESLSYAANPPSLLAKIKESGPIRAILNVQGRIVLKDRRGEIVLLVDCDYCCFAGRPEIHMRPMLLGAVTEATSITDWSLALHLKNGKRVQYGSMPELVRIDPNHEHMTWRALPRGWASWTLANKVRLTAWSPDFARHQNGLVCTEVMDRDRKHLRVAFGRVEPFWGYHDVGNPAKSIVINRGGWRRWEAVFGLHRAGLHPGDCAARWQAPLRAFPSVDHYRKSYGPWLEGITKRSRLRKQIAKKCGEFVCREPEYAGSLHGGYDAINRTYLERGVARGEFGEYLFNEFFRSGQKRFHQMAFNFGRVYRDIFCFTIPEATAGATELGAARMRQSEHYACSIRSYRGAVLLAYMYQETGDERYLEALRQRAAFHLANYPHQIGRLSMSTRDTAFMGHYLCQPALTQKAVEVGLHSLDSHFDPKDGFYEGYQPLAEGEKRSRPASCPKGYWFMGDFLRHSNACPEMTVYNIIGLYGLCRLHDPGDEFRAKLRRVCEWFRSVQNQDGSWSYPEHSSRTRWGHGCLQDAMGMLMAYRLFGDDSYLTAARRSIAFAEKLLRKHGRIPLLIGLSPFDQTEDSLVYYYGIETLALYEETLARGKTK